MTLDLNFLIYEEQKREREQHPPVYEQAVIMDEEPEPRPAPTEVRVNYEL